MRIRAWVRLASLGQRDEVRERIQDLLADAEIVAGNPNEVRVISGDAGKGAFLNPVLLYADDPFGATTVHDVEAFGPVSTVLPYDDIAQAVELAKLGKGSLVSSIFTDDPKVAEDVVIGVAPFHGRVLIGNRRSAKTSTGPRLALGGPGAWRSWAGQEAARRWAACAA